MIKNYGIHSKYAMLLIWMLLLFLPGLASAQLPPFTLYATASAETCSGNACVFFTVTDTVEDATIVFEVFPSDDPSNLLTTTQEDSYCGLTAGDYTVIATQSFAGESSVQQIEFIVVADIEDLSYEITDQTDGCGESGTLTVVGITGHPAQYEILSGPETRPLQSSPSFSGLSNGTYVIRVLDDCGDGVVQTYTLVLQPPSLSFVATPTTDYVDCDTVLVNQVIGSSSSMAFPITVVYTVNFPDGSTISETTVIPNGDGANITLAQELPLNVNEEYTYTITISDSCSNEVTHTGLISINLPQPIITTNNSGCDSASYIVLFPEWAVVTEAPAEYQALHDLPYSIPQIGVDPNVFLLGELPAGSYMIQAGLCGEVYDLPLEVLPPVVTNPVVSVVKGCEEGFGSVYIQVYMGAETAQVVSAPEAFGSSLPADAPMDNGAVRMNNLPAGTYVFSLVNTCGDTFEVTVEIDPLVTSNESEVIFHCGSFDIDLQYSDNSSGTISFWLQKYNPETGQWGHPQTGAAYTEGTQPTNANSLGLSNNTLNDYFTVTGHFRVISYRTVYAVNAAERHCIRTLLEFDFLGVPDIVAVYSFSCSDGTNEVIVEAEGSEPLIYRITSFNGGPFLVDNGTSNHFAGLLPGIYNFQVEDVCQNLVNQLYDISDPYEIQISGEGLCEGSPAVMSVASFGFLNYSWYKDDPSQVLSTGPFYQIPEFSEDDLGAYHVHITTSFPDSCLDLTLSFSFDEIELLPRAGQDSLEKFCGPQGMMNLSDYLSGDFQNGGSWEALTEGVVIESGQWNSEGAAVGIYDFRYTVTNECGQSDAADISLSIKPVPPMPEPSASTGVCENGSIELWVEPVAGATYLWQGPNGFTSTESNPIIPNAGVAQEGNYYVQMSLGDCPSGEAMVTVEIDPMPQLNMVFGCVANRMILEVSANPEGAYDFQWSGPEGFSASGESIDITGNPPGDYVVSATNASGCVSELSRNIMATLCQITSGISPNDDGDNDSFDLEGLGEIENVKIFNRYGMTVYEKSRYVNEWRGQDYNGNLLPSATYYYLIRLANGEARTGWVYLMRP